MERQQTDRVIERVPMRRLEFTNQLMFRKVMDRADDICEEFIARILGFPIERIERKTVEYPRDPTLSSRGTRLDVYLKGSGKLIDLEMQASPAYGIGKRMRYYQGAMDVSELRRSDEVEDLPESYIIFVCKHDPFAFGIPRYTIEPTCVEAGELDLEAQAHWLVLNAAAYDDEADPALRSLLQYVADGTVDEDDPLIRHIADEVDYLNEFDEEVKVFWTLEDEWALQTKHKVKEATEEAYAEGAAQVSKLMKLLFDAGRIEDAERAANDEAYRAGLLKEFGIA